MRVLPPFLLACLVVLASAPPARAIVGGEPAQGEFPFFTQLVFDGDTNCGGALVRPQWVLTAAHCAFGERPEEINVIVGSKVRGQGERIAVARYEIHPGFSEESIPVLKAAWDVAVLELARPVDAPLIGFADPAAFVAGTPAVVIGMGADGFAIGSYRNELYQATLPIVSDEECSRPYGGRYDPEQHICAGTLEYDSATCQGDSGGPLMVRDARSGWALVGNVSFGTACGAPGFYSVFARSAGAPLRGWIESQLPPPARPAAPGPGGAPQTPPAAAPSRPVRLTVSPVRRGARSVRARVSGPAEISVRDGRRRLLGSARARAAGTVVVRLRHPARPGKLIVRAGDARRVVRVRVRGTR